MRREVVPLLLAFALLGCGARTGLEAENLADSGAEKADSGPRLCPRRPPRARSRCRERAAALECDYLESSSSQNIAFCCEFGGWVDCTTVADTLFTSCADRVCTPDVDVECIVGDGRECCTCGADMTADQCGPC